ncbi:MAG: hypothetical protein ACI8YQ_002160 [Polaribacter sp.]|jgi:hypothetical protein
MKTPSTLLFDLLKSLSGSELRYLKVQMGQIDKGYTRLMTAVLAQNSYNEELLKVENSEESYIKNLSVNKRYLLDLVLDLLSRFSQAEQSEQILKELRFAKILFQKNFLTAAQRKLKKAKQLAKKLDAYEELLLIYSLEKQLLTTDRYELSQIQNLHEAIRQTVQKIQNINDYWFFYTRLYQLQLQKQNNSTVDTEIKDIVASPFFQEEEQAITVRSKMYRYQARANFFFGSRQPEKAIESNLAFLKLLDTNANYRQRFSEAYFSTLNNFLIDSLMLRKFDALDEGLLKLEQAKEDPAFVKIKNLKSRVFRQTMMLQLNRAMASGTYERAIVLMPKLKEGLSEFEKQIEPQHKIAIQYLTAYLLFKNKDYEEVINWTNVLLQKTDESILSEYFHYTRWLNLIAHFELGNYQLVGSLLRQTKRYVRQNRKLMKTEALLFKTLKKATGLADKRRAGAMVREMEKPLVALKTEERLFFQYLDLEEWVKGR